MAIIKQLNKKTGITYVYESHSYRDKTTGQPRSKRKIIGRIDEATGNIVPTRKRRAKVTTSSESGQNPTTETNESPSQIPLNSIHEKEAIITEQRQMILKLKKEKKALAEELERLAATLKE